MFTSLCSFCLGFTKPHVIHGRQKTCARTRILLFSPRADPRNSLTNATRKESQIFSVYFGRHGKNWNRKHNSLPRPSHKPIRSLTLWIPTPRVRTLKKVATNAIPRCECCCPSSPPLGGATLIPFHFGKVSLCPFSLCGWCCLHPPPWGGTVSSPPPLGSCFLLLLLLLLGILHSHNIERHIHKFNSSRAKTKKKEEGSNTAPKSRGGGSTTHKEEEMREKGTSAQRKGDAVLCGWGAPAALEWCCCHFLL